MAGATPRRISETEKASYATNRLGLTMPGPAYERFCYLIDAQDDAYLDWHAKQMKRGATGDGDSSDGSDGQHEQHEQHEQHGDDGTNTDDDL